MDDPKPILGDRLTGCKLIIDALDRSEIDAEQAERLLDGLIPPQNIIQPEPRQFWPQGPLNNAADELAQIDAREQAEREAFEDGRLLEVRSELQAAIDHDLEQNTTPSPPVKPVAPGQNLLDDPQDFVARAAEATARKAANG
jgi:hypothetical protein